MKRYIFFILLALLSISLLSCTPIIRTDLMDISIRNFSMSELEEEPELYEGKLFVFGGIIVDTRVNPQGSLIDALYIPVDSRGYLKGVGQYQVRFLAFYPKDGGILDPIIFGRGRQITLAGEFLGRREGKIDVMTRALPFFRIKDIYLWEEHKEYTHPYYFGAPPPWSNWH